MTTPDALLDAILPHVAFDGWSDASFATAVADSNISLDQARAICPRGAADLAVQFHKAGDAAMVAALANAALTELRFRDRVAHAIRLRLEAVEDKEAVRRGTALFALPHMAPEGSKLIWGTADAIWTALGDTSDDVNFYTKRATLSAVYASVVLFWLGDDKGETDAFIDRRIDNVMQFEALKTAINKNPLTKPFASALGRFAAHIKAPAEPPTDLPGTRKSPE